MNVAADRQMIKAITDTARAVVPEGANPFVENVTKEGIRLR